jgi:hypothetical protein
MEASMNRIDISLFGFRLTARGLPGILGAVVVTAMLLAYAVAMA